MTTIPMRCVVDTNVATTANGANSSAPITCVAASAKALQSVMNSGHVFVDDSGLIVSEYRSNLEAKGEPGPGDAFLKWILTHEWGGVQVTRVAITPKPHDNEDFNELTVPPKGVVYDRSDKKFLAVAAAHSEKPPILQSFDSKWWGWQEALKQDGVRIFFVCADAIAAKYAEKMAQ